MQHGQIRRVELEDANALERLFDALGHPANATSIRRRLSRLRTDPSYASWVAILDGEVVGFAAGHLLYPVEEDHPAAQLIALVTAPEHEGAGNGTALCQEFEAWARTNGVRRLIVNSGAHRVETHAFYVRRGYTRTGVRFARLLGDI